MVEEHVNSYENMPKDIKDRIIESEINSFKEQEQWLSVTKKDLTHEENQRVSYAYEVSGQDKTFVYLLEGEGGYTDIKRKSDKSYWINGKEHWDWGFCQVSDHFHPTVVNDERFFTDWRWQIDKCYELYSKGVTFYGINNIPQVRHLFTFNL